MGNDTEIDSLHCPICGASFAADSRVCPRDGVALESGRDPFIGRELRETFRVTRVLGEGALGRVYHAAHMRLPREYAIKVPRGIWIDHAKSRARFFNEATAAGRLSHPNIAGVIDVGETEQLVPYLVMELAQGIPLSELIARGPTPIRDALLIAREIALGLEHAHELGIVHRDLKPDNVLVHGLKPRIVDFGIALVTDLGEKGRFTTRGIVIGTPGYMAPEQLLDQAIDPRADLYALGVMLYELIVGRRLYNGSAVEVAQRTISGAPPSIVARTPWLELDARIDILCQWLMARKADRRPHNATLVIEAIDSILTQLPVETARVRAQASRPPLTKPALEPTIEATPSVELEVVGATSVTTEQTVTPRPWWRSLLWWRNDRRRSNRE